MNEIHQSQEVLNEIECSIGRINGLLDSNKNISAELVKHWTAIKAIVLGITVISTMIAGTGVFLLVHYQQEKAHYQMLETQISIMSQRTDFFMSATKQLQQQVFELHRGDTHDQCSK